MTKRLGSGNFKPITERSPAQKEALAYGTKLFRLTGLYYNVNGCSALTDWQRKVILRELQSAIDTANREHQAFKALSDRITTE